MSRLHSRLYTLECCSTPPATGKKRIAEMAKKAKAATPAAAPVAKKTKAAKQAAVKAETKKPPPKKVPEASLFRVLIVTILISHVIAMPHRGRVHY